MCVYLSLGRSLVGNLLTRLWTDLVDWLAKCCSLCRPSSTEALNNITIQTETSTEGSIVGISTDAELESRIWYHAADRVHGEELVTAGGNGCFIIRPSLKHPLILTLRYGDRSYNIPVRQRDDSKISLGTKKPHERAFNTLDELIEFYKTEELILFSRGERTGACSLKSTLAKIPSSEGVEALPHTIIYI